MGELANFRFDENIFGDDRGPMKIFFGIELANLGSMKIFLVSRV